MGITNSYTMEATFCGSLLGKLAGYQFSTTDLEAMGYHFCDTLLDYCDPDQSKVKCLAIITLHIVVVALVFPYICMYMSIHLAMFRG